MTYKFRVESRNSYGYSSASYEISIICATTPSVPATLISQNILDYVQLSWVAPSSNGLAITSYTVLIRKSDNTYIQNIAFCNGANSVVLSTTLCTIPLSILTASPFNLVYGD